MLGGYTSHPRAAVALWCILAVWIVAGPVVWFHQNYAIILRSSVGANDVPQPILTQIRWQFIGGEQSPIVLYENNIATWYTLWTPSVQMQGLDVHGKIVSKASAGPCWFIFLTFTRPITFKQLTLISPNISSWEVKQTSDRAAIILVNQDIPAGVVEVSTIP